MKWDFSSLSRNGNWNKWPNANARKTVPRLVLFVINVLLEETLNVINGQ